MRYFNVDEIIGKLIKFSQNSAKKGKSGPVLYTVSLFTRKLQDLMINVNSFNDFNKSITDLLNELCMSTIHTLHI